MFEKGLKMKKRILKIIIIAGLLVCMALFGFAVYGRHQMAKIPGLSFQEALEYTTGGNPDAVITVGIIKDGQISYRVYGENGQELPTELHTYEIGSLTKTFTAALIYKAEQEGKLELTAAIDHYLKLPEGNAYPTVEALLTHTSGYKGYYLEKPMISNFLNGRNDFFGITGDMVLARLGKLSVPKENYQFTYSNFGFATLGQILESVYDCDFRTLMNEFVQQELGLLETKVSEQDGDLGNYWDWKTDDAYLSAGALTSNIEDMLAYAGMQLEANAYFDKCHESIKEINASTVQYEMMGIRMDEIGMAWIIDRENGILWHNGGTGNYNCYLGVSREKNMAVVVLSNLKPGYRIPATVLGVKLLTQDEL